MKPGTISRVRRAITSGKLDSGDVFQFFKSRIKADLDAVEAGRPTSDLNLPTTNAITSFVHHPKRTNSAGQLTGIPFLAKDNYCSSDNQATSCSSKTLASYTPPYTASVGRLVLIRNMTRS